MHIETMDRQAFELVSKAIEFLDQYNQDRQLSFLKEAESALQGALKRDPQYLDASYYSGVVKDLIGKPADAVPIFEEILNGLPRDGEDRRSEVEYSRGVAWYHQYSHRKLERAKADFSAVVERSTDPNLKLLARAGLAQTYAMWMIPTADEKTRLIQERAPEVLISIAERRTQCLQEVEFVNSKLRHRSRIASSKSPASMLSRSVKGTVLNAQGMCMMYWTDYNVLELAEREKLLREAVYYLNEADRYLPDDWANTCDIGSAHFRMGVVAKSSDADPSTEFKTAIDKFQRVIGELRPGYGFGLYERGRIYRVWGRFDEAKSSLNEALQVPVEYRDVGDENVNIELSRTEQGDSTYP